MLLGYATLRTNRGGGRGRKCDKQTVRPRNSSLTSTVPNSVRPSSRKPFTSVLAAVTLETPAALRPDRGVSGHSYPVSMQPHTRFTRGARTIRTCSRADRMVSRSRSMRRRGRKWDTAYRETTTEFENACGKPRSTLREGMTLGACRTHWFELLGTFKVPDLHNQTRFAFRPTFTITVDAHLDGQFGQCTHKSANKVWWYP